MTKTGTSSTIERDQAPSDELIGKIRKALVLARNEGATGGEAAAALEAVSRMLLKYNLELADVETRSGDGEGTSGAITENRLDIGSVEWRWNLAKAVIEHNFCKPFEYQYGPDGKVRSCTVLGAPANVEVVVMLTDWLFRQVEAGARESWRARTPDGRWNADSQRMEKKTAKGTRIVVMPRGWEYVSPARWYSSFSSGAANRLAERLSVLRTTEAQEEGEASVHALVLSVDTAIRDYLEKKYPWRKEQRLAAERREQEQREKAEALVRWRAEHPEEAKARDAADREAAAEREREWEKEWKRKRREREAYEERYYRDHGHYPGDGRPRARYVEDTTNSDAYNDGAKRAEQINLTPYIGGAERNTTLP